MKNAATAFNEKQTEDALVRQMSKAFIEAGISPKDIAKVAQDSGVLVPSVRDRDGSGYDIFSLLLKERIVMVGGEVEPAMAQVIIAQLQFLDQVESKDGDNAIKMIINSPGGSVIDGSAIYDTMRQLKCDVVTIGAGMQASMGSVLLVGGDKRFATENSRIMVHSIASGTQGELVAQEIGLEVTRRLFEDMKAVYIRHTGLNEKYWDLCCARNTWFTAEQAKKIGFIHDVYRNKKAAPYESAAAEFLKAKQDRREAEVPKKTEDILQLFQGTSDDDGLGERRRAEALVELAQRPLFWVKEKQLEFAARNNVDLGRANTQEAIAVVLQKHLDNSKTANDNAAVAKRTNVAKPAA